MVKTLRDIAVHAGLRDMNALQSARADLKPAEALEDLRSRMPQAFAEPFDARTATDAEYNAALRRRGLRVRRSY